MKTGPKLMRFHPSPVLIVILVVASTSVQADPPKVSSFFPGGGRIGESVRVEAKGTFKPWPVQVHVDRPGICFEPEEEVGVFTVSLSEEAIPGVYWVRLFNDDGAASLRPFLVGTLPEVMEVEPNNADDQAQVVDPSGVVVNGRLEKAGDVDSFAVHLESGQTLVAALEANNRLGSPMDGKLQVVSPGGFVVDHADDSPLLDPNLAFTAPTSDTYIVRVFAFPEQPDSSIRFSGSDDYIYRLTLTTGGYLDLSHPSVIACDGKTAVAAVGWNLPGEPSRLQLSHGPEKTSVAWQPDFAGFAEVSEVKFPILLASEIDQHPIMLPAIICGQLGPGGNGDRFQVKADPRASVLLRVEARSFGSPMDAVLKVGDTSGNQLAEMDDLRRQLDPELIVNVPDDGILDVHLRDLHHRGGPRYLYRLEAREANPEVTLTVESDHYEVDPGKSLSIEVNVERQGEFKEPIAVEIQGLPEGINVKSAVSEPEGDSSKKVTLEINAEDAPAWSGSIRILATSEEGSTFSSATAERVGGSRTEALWLTIRPAS